MTGKKMTVGSVVLLLETLATRCGEGSKARGLCREAIDFICRQEKESENIAVLAEARRLEIEQLQSRLEAAEKVCKLAQYKQHNLKCAYATPRMIDEPCSCGAWQFNKELAEWRGER